MRKMLCAALAAAMILLSVAAAQTPKQPVKKKVPATAVRKTPAPAARKGTATARKSTTPAKKGTTSTARTGSRKAAPRRPAVTWRNRQNVPSQERYREIQNALVTRGFLPAEEATGVWNQASIDALKRFQAAQNLESSGKINSLSLIALGLGPKRDAVPVVPPKPPVDGQ